MVTSVALSPDGKIVLTGSRDKTARLWDAATWKPIGPPLMHDKWVNSVAFSPNGRTVLTGSGDNELGSGTARLWDVATGEPLGAAMGHQGEVSSVAFSPNGKTGVTGSFARTVRLWDTETGQPLGAHLGSSDSLRTIAYSADHKTAVLGNRDGSAQLWDTTTGRRRGALLQHPGVVNAAAFSPDGKFVMSGCGLHDIGSGKGLGWSRLWDAGTGLPFGLAMKHNDGVGVEAISPDSKVALIVCFDKTARLWEIATGRPIGAPMAHQVPVSRASFSPDGKAVLTLNVERRGFATARLWDAATGQLRGKPFDYGTSIHTVVVFSPDDGTLLTGGLDNRARLWDVATGQPSAVTMKHLDEVLDACFSFDGRTLVTLESARKESESSGGTVRWWDTATGRIVGTPMKLRARCSLAKISPDGKTALTVGDSKLQACDVATGQTLGPPLAVQMHLSRVVFSTDRGTAIGLTAKDGARLWNIQELPDDLPRLANWVKVVTGLRLDGAGQVQSLDRAAWQVSSRRLEEQGGPPETNTLPKIDPVLNGPDPINRARFWVERQSWEQADASFDEAVLARPYDASILLERGRYHRSCMRPEKAGDDFVRAYALGSHDKELEAIVLGWK